MHPRVERFQRRTIGQLSSLQPLFGYWFKMQSKLPTILHLSEANEEKRNLFVLLPGIADQHLDFEFAGFISAARELKLQGDLVAVDAHIGYYLREEILKRLREDVILPARQQGYEKIWLVGTSLGALGSALYSIEHGADIDGIFLIAPFLGDRALIQEIRSVGGLRIWQSSFRSVKVAAYQIALWEGLKKQLFESPNPIQIYLGFGESDRFAESQKLLAESLPQKNVMIEKGGHNWQTWARLWRKFLTEIQKSA